MRMGYNGVYHTKKGLKRDRNQDSYLIMDKGNYTLFIVFDGVSSYIDSYRFIDAFKRILKSELKQLSFSNINISKALFHAHNRVLQLKINGKSTISLLLVDKDFSNKFFVNIGDSRIYIFTKQYLQKITHDDSLAGSSNIITRCLGMTELSEEDFKLAKIEKGNNFLICSDGFYSLMENNIKDYFMSLNYNKFRNIKRKLSSLQRGNNMDDSTYIVIKNEISN